MMPLNNASPAFKQRYASHLKHLKLQGLQPKTVDAYARALRTMGEYFDWQIDALSEAQLTDYFHQRIASHSWSAVKLDLYGYKFYVIHTLRQPWTMPRLIRPPKTSRLPDIVTVQQAQALLPGAYFLITFTLPQELRGLAWSHQPTVYAALMQCAWDTLAQFSLNHRQLQGVGNGEKALVYLGRYLYRGVIQEKDIVRCAAGRVTYRYRDSASGRNTTRTVTGTHFLWLVLQHVLPKGFRRSRNFGLAHPNCKHRQRLALLRMGLKTNAKATCTLNIQASAQPALSERPKLKCKCCGSAMVIVRRRIAPLTSKGRATEPPSAAREAHMN